MICGYVSLDGIGEYGDLIFRDLSPSNDLRLLSLIERTSSNPQTVTWIPCPDGTLVIPREPERQYADNLVQWIVEKRSAIVQAANLAKKGGLSWRSALKFLLYYPSCVTPKSERSLRGVSVYLPKAPYSGNLARISVVALMKAPNLEEPCSSSLELYVFPEDKADNVMDLWKKIGELANPFSKKIRDHLKQSISFHPSQIVFSDSRIWIDTLRRTETYSLLSLTILEKGTRPISGLIGSSRQMNEELSKKLGEDIMGGNDYYQLIKSLKIVNTRKRETVW